MPGRYLFITDETAIGLACPLSRNGLSYGITQAGSAVWAVAGGLTGSEDYIAEYTGGAWTAMHFDAGSVRVIVSNALAGVSTGVVWAGVRDDATGTDGMVYTWNGSVWALADTWNIIGAPGLNGTYYKDPAAVTAVSASDVYAIGTQGINITPATGGQHIRHWSSGTWAWDVMPAAINGLIAAFGLTNAGASDVWVCGSNLFGSPSTRPGEFAGRVTGSSTGSTYQSVHWGRLYGIYAADSTHVYAVGYRTTARTSGDDFCSAVWYNGSAWADWGTLPTLPVGAGLSYLQAVQGTSSSDIWAVGWYYIDSGQTGSLPLAYHWDGSVWTDLSPAYTSASGQYIFLYSVAAITSTDVWASGFMICLDSTYHTLTLHWDGSAWADIPIP